MGGVRALKTGTNTGRPAIIRMIENREVSLWQLTSPRPKRKRSVASCTSSNMGNSQPVAVKSEETETGNSNWLARGRCLEIREQGEKSRTFKANEGARTTRRD